MTPHPHAKWIKAKADGHTVQRKTIYDSEWEDMAATDWFFIESCQFRIKPAEPVLEYPVTRMSNEMLSMLWKSSHEPYAAASLRTVANAAIRHAIDAQQVVRMAEVQEIASQLGKDKRDDRELRIAEAVRDAYDRHQRGPFSGVVLRPGLLRIIASVK